MTLKCFQKTGSNVHCYGHILCDEMRGFCRGQRTKASKTESSPTPGVTEGDVLWDLGMSQTSGTWILDSFEVFGDFQQFLKAFFFCVPNFETCPILKLSLMKWCEAIDLGPWNNPSFWRISCRKDPGTFVFWVEKTRRALKYALFLIFCTSIHFILRCTIVHTFCFFFAITRPPTAFGCCL